MPVEETAEKTTGRTKRNDIDVAPLSGWTQGPEDNDNYGIQVGTNPFINVKPTNQNKLSPKPTNIKINIGSVDLKSKN